MAWIPFERKGDYEDIHSRHHHTRRSIAGCCVLICTFLIVSILVLGIAMLIAYLILRPYATHYEIVAATVPTLEVTPPLNPVMLDTINAKFIYSVRFKNDNIVRGVEYSKINVQTLFQRVDIGSSSRSGIRVDPRSSKTVTVTTSASNVVVNNIVSNRMQSEIKQKFVTVTVEIDTRARVYFGGFTFFSWSGQHDFCDVSVTPPDKDKGPGSLLSVDCHNAYNRPAPSADEGLQLSNRV